MKIEIRETCVTERDPEGDVVSTVMEVTVTVEGFAVHVAHKAGSEEVAITLPKAIKVTPDQLEEIAKAVSNVFFGKPEPKQDPACVELWKKLDKPVSELELTVLSAQHLRNANIRYVGELVRRNEAEMLKTKNFGRKALKEVKAILAEMGLSLGMDILRWVSPP